MNLNSQTRNHTNLLYSIKFWILTLILILIYSTFIFAQDTVFIDPTNSGDPGQIGSRDHPWDSWSDLSVQSNTVYLQQRGTVETRTSPAITLSTSTGNLHNIYFGAYGEGDRPEIIVNGATAIYIKYTHNITISDLKITGDYSPEDGIMISGHTSGTINTNVTTIQNCEITQFGCGITSSEYGTSTDSITIDNCDIHHIDQDAIFCQGDYLTVKNSHIHHVNRRWHTVNHTQTDAGGDCIQIRGGNHWLVLNNILDRRWTGNKFCLIWGSSYYRPTTGKILWNTFYPPKDTIDDQGGDAIYISPCDSVEIAYNKFLGTGYGEGELPIGLLHSTANKVKFYYNLVDSVSEINFTLYNSPNKELYIYNNTFVNQFNKVLFSAFDDVCEVKNNIIATHSGANIFSGIANYDTSNNIIVIGDSSNWGTNPGFVDWQNKNYRIKETSPATNSGSDYIGCFCDLDSNAVPYQFIRDIGVFEYTDGPTSNNPPNIINQNFNIEENSANGQAVGTVVASDPDPGQSLVFSILSGNTDNAFQIGATSGSLSVANVDALDFETNPSFNLSIQVQDNGPGGLTNQATITINLTDANEVPEIVNQSFLVNENSNNGTEVGTVLAADPDNGQALSYSIISGNTGNAFQINSSSGVLTVATASALDFENNPTFNLIVRAQDNGAGNLYSEATITVNLTDVNEVPQIVNQNFAIDENSNNGTQVGTVVASDPDNGQTLSFSILSGNTSNAFQINSGSGVLTVANSAALDFELNPIFSLEVRAQDNGPGNLYSLAEVTVNLADVNEVPQIVNQSFSLNENSTNGTQVGSVVATDPDNGQILTFSIISGNSGNAFQINSGSGLITVINSNALDFEDNPTFTLTIRAQDNGPGSLFSEATATVNLLDVNEMPQIVNQMFDIDENSNSGTQLGIVVASDPDNGQSISYSILSGNTGGTFGINSATGVLSIASNSLLDYESNPVFNLDINVVDDGPGALSNQATITINLNDVNEMPEMEDQTFSIDENTAYGSQVGMVSASDPDNGQSLTFSILSGNIDNAFQINSGSGELSVANSSALNYENNSSFSLAISVQDNGLGNLSDQATIYVNLNDVNEVPEIANQGFVIEETISNGELVGVVLASDPDNGQSLTFSILSGDPDGAFSLNPSTGELQVANNNAFDFNTYPIYYLEIQVQDNGPGNLTGQAVITVSLTDINQAPSIENQSFYISENSANGVTVGTLSATDPDLGQTLTFSILTGNTANAFQINPTSGLLSVDNSSVLDFESVPVFNLTVEVQDDGPGNLTDLAIVTVNLTDVNEVPSVNDATFALDENSPNGQQVGIVTANDPDNGQTLSYSIISGNVDNAFQIGLNSGTITVSNSAALNFESSAMFSLVVEVQDDGSGNLSDQATVTVNLNDVNEIPEIDDQTLSIDENSSIGQQVGMVIAFDPDFGQSVSYSIVSGNIGDAFQIESNSGIITVSNPDVLDFESIPSFTILVEVQDDGQGNLTNQANIVVNINDINEVPNIENQEFNIEENSPQGEQLGVVIASDPDNGQTLQYSISAGNTNDVFQIGANTGILSVANSAELNFEETPDYSLTIQVEDDGFGNLSDVATIIVNVTDINETPEIEAQQFAIDENSSVGDPVGTVIATDPDQGQSLTFNILSGNSGNAFEINSLSGLITVANSSALNYELIPSFDLLIQIMDNGQGNLTVEEFITIYLNDINENPEIENQLFDVDEFSPFEYEVGLVEASDPDNGQSLTYSIVSGNVDEAFQIDPQTGMISVKSSDALDYEVNPVFNLIVQVQDDGMGYLMDQATVIITVIDMTSITFQPGSVDLTYSLFPNPAKEAINLTLDNLENGELVIIISKINGEVLLKKEFQVFDHELSVGFDLFDLQKGLYIINIINGKVAVMDKFIKL